MNEFLLLSKDERMDWCRMKLRRMDELAVEISANPDDPDCVEALRSIAGARRAVEAGLAKLERPSFWQRINFAVSAADAHARVKDSARQGDLVEVELAEYAAMLLRLEIDRDRRRQ